MLLGSNWPPSADCCDWMREMQNSSNLGSVEESEEPFEFGCEHCTVILEVHSNKGMVLVLLKKSGKVEVGINW